MKIRQWPSHFELLESELLKFQIELPRSQQLTLAAYCDEVTHWNKKINLTGLIGADMVRRLVVEPAWIGLQLKPEGVLADIGSGNGSPGIPLHVVCGFEMCHLIEARARRAAFLRHLVTTLKLPDVRVHRARFEAVSSSLGAPNWISLRGVALTKELLESIRPVTFPTATIVWMTSPAVRTALKPTNTLRVPFSDTEVLLFQLDLS